MTSDESTPARAERLTPRQGTVLSLVIERPSRGFDVWQRYNERFAGLAPVSASTILKTLCALEELGLVEAPRDREAPEAALRTVLDSALRFRATSNGALAHCEWLVETLRDDPLRRDVLHGLLAAGDLDAMLELLAHYERTCLAEMQWSRTPILHGEDAALPTPVRVAQRLIAEDRQIVMQGRMTFIAQARQLIEAERRPRDR